MADKVKRDWVRILLDIMVPLIVAMLVWAGSILWQMNASQLRLVTSQNGLADTVHKLQQSQTVLDDRITEFDIWKAETSGNRFTTSDGQDLWRELQTLKEYVISLPLGDPPDWFIQRVSRIEVRIDELEHRFNEQ